MVRTNGVLVCDQSYKGAGVVVYVPSAGTFTQVYDITQGKKASTFMKPNKTIILVRDWLEQLAMDCPFIDQVDTLLLESQFTTNMKGLTHIVASAMTIKFPSIKRIMTVTPYSAKRAVKAASTGSHYQNKIEMLKTIESSPHLLLSSWTKGDHNIADAIALLNAAIINKKITMPAPKIIDPNNPPECCTCGNVCMQHLVKKEGPNLGRSFWSCPTRECVGEFYWGDIAVHIRKTPTKSKEPATKKQCTTDIRDDTMKILTGISEKLDLLLSTMDIPHSIQ